MEKNACKTGFLPLLLKNSALRELVNSAKIRDSNLNSKSQFDWGLANGQKR